MIPQAELDRLKSNRSKSRKEVRSFQYKLKVDLIQARDYVLIQVGSRQNEVEENACTCSDHCDFDQSIRSIIGRSYAVLLYSISFVATSKKTKLNTDGSEITSNVSETAFETLAKRLKRVGNWS